MTQEEKKPIDNILYAAACGIKNTVIMTQEDYMRLPKERLAELLAERDAQQPIIGKLYQKTVCGMEGFVSIHSTTARLARVDSYTHTTQTQHQQMNKQVEQIRAEVERRLNEITINVGEARPRLHGKRRAYLDVLGIIDSLPDEQPSKDLETEIATWIQSHLEIKNEQFEIYREPMTKWAEAIARHFAKWGAEHQVIDGNKMIERSKDLDEATEKLIDEALYKWSHNDEGGKEQSFTHHEIDESLQDAVTHQMEDDGDVDDFVRKGIDNIALKYAELGANWQAEHTEDFPMPEDTVLFQKGVAEGKRLMMEDAVDAHVSKIGGSGFVKEERYSTLMAYLDRFKDGDKVKVIIVKEGEQ